MEPPSRFEHETPGLGFQHLNHQAHIFPSVLRTAKAVPVFKKDSKLDFSNYHPISLLSNIEKILEKRMYETLHTFRQQYSTSHALINITEI